MDPVNYVIMHTFFPTSCLCQNTSSDFDLGHFIFRLQNEVREALFWGVSKIGHCPM